MNIEKMIKIVTGKQVNVDHSVPLSYILSRGIYYFQGLIRGFLKSLSLNKRLFIGKRR